MNKKQFKWTKNLLKCDKKIVQINTKISSNEHKNSSN